MPLLEANLAITVLEEGIKRKKEGLTQMGVLSSEWADVGIKKSEEIVESIKKKMKNTQ